jgi:hypothetical protein
VARPTHCVFCGSDDLNKEHLWSDWMRGLLVDKRVAVAHTQDLGDGETRAWKAPPFTATVRCVCRACNSSWMNDLEHAVKPHLAPLIRAAPRIVSTRAQTVLAAWTYLKVLLFSQWPRSSEVFTDEDHRAFAADRRPPVTARIAIAGYHADESLAHFTYRGVDLTAADGTLLDPANTRAQLATLTINHVVLQVFTHALKSQIDYLPGPPYDEATNAIWPTTMPFVWPTTLMNHAALQELMTPHGVARPR